MAIAASSHRRLLIEFGEEKEIETSFTGADLRLRPILGSRTLESTVAVPPTLFLAEGGPPARAMHPWDEAHQAVEDAGFLEAPAPVSYAEPDLLQTFAYRPGPDLGLEARRVACVVDPPDPNWPTGTFAWHLEDEYSQLRSARQRVGDPGNEARIRIALLDTGYDPRHASRPRHLNEHLARNLIGDGRPDDATDPGRHFPGDNPGHGTATLALLAGNQVDGSPSFRDFLGGAPFAEVVPVRIANSVIHFYTSAMAKGIEYAAQNGCQVISISMGGVPSRAWARAVNTAYEAGVTIVAAAGNNIGGLPTRSLVYPARFGRVLAVCGATADRTPYYAPGSWSMQGNFGPPACMKTAIAAYTPNAPWAEIGCSHVIDLDGAGTSAATPQVAAACALWLQQHANGGGLTGWQRVEAVRNALFQSADTRAPDSVKYFGRGLLRSRAALDVSPRTDLPITPADSVSFPWIRMLFELEAVSLPQGRLDMYETEALQIFLRSAALQEIAEDADPVLDALPDSRLYSLLKALSNEPSASVALRDFVARNLAR